MSVICRLLAAVVCVLHVQHAWSQEYPAKPVRWVVPYPAGGTSDFLARLIGQKLTETWKQNVLVDNRSGAAGNIGTEAVAKAPPDGYTMVLVASTLTMNPAIYPKIGFDAEKDLAPVTILLWQPLILVAHPSMPVKSVRQLIELARAKPGEINIGSGGTGTTNHVLGELFLSMAGVKMTHVPYRGMGPAITAVVSGESHLTFASSVVVLPYIEQGRLKALGTTGRKRVPAMPNLPTIAEAGVRGYDEGNWQGVLVPAHTPRPLVLKLNQDLVRVLRTPEITEQIRRVGADVIANTPEAFAAVIRTDLKKYAEVVKRVGIRLE